METMRFFMSNERYVDQLVMRGSYAEAAAMLPSVLRGSPSAWQWWIQNFIRLGQIAALLPYIPTYLPQLTTPTYDAILDALIASKASQHLVLPTVKKWGPQLFTVKELVRFLEQQERLEQEGLTPDSDPSVVGEGRQVEQDGTIDLDEALAYALALDRQFDKALQVYLRPWQARLQSKAGAPIGRSWPPVDIFRFIKEHGVLFKVRNQVVRLFEINEVKAAALLVDAADEIPPEEVVTQLSQGPAEKSEVLEKPGTSGKLEKSGKSAASGTNGLHGHQSNGFKPAGGSTRLSAELEPQGCSQQVTWRRFLYQYLHALFEKRPDLSAPFQRMQVPLYAEFDRGSLLPFLRRAQQYNLEEALKVCAKQGFAEEQAYLLGRIGDYQKAIQVTLEQLHDVHAAVAFAHDVGDEDLWEELFDIAARHANLICPLLEETVGITSPVELLRRVPPNFGIPGLVQALLSIITRFHTEESLMTGTLAIIQKEQIDLLLRLIQEAGHGILVAAGGLQKPGILSGVGRAHRLRVSARAEGAAEAGPNGLPMHAGDGAISSSAQQREQEELKARLDSAAHAEAILQDWWDSESSFMPMRLDPQADLREERDPSAQCAGCLESLAPGGAIIVFLCGHSFHRDCAGAETDGAHVACNGQEDRRGVSNQAAAPARTDHDRKDEGKLICRVCRAVQQTPVQKEG